MKFVRNAILAALSILGAFALADGPTVIIRMGKPSYAWVTAVPLAFITVTMITASHMLFYGFLDKADADPASAFTYRLNAVLMAVMAGLVLVVLPVNKQSFSLLFSIRLVYL